jgi:HAD superfamily hydrolase (TIGR01450 family)
VLLIFDLDGVVYRGHEPVPGMPELLRERQRMGHTIVYCTNNSRWHRSEYIERLSGIGAPVTADQIVTSARATALAVADPDGGQRGRAHADGPAARRVMVLGGEGLGNELLEVGLLVLPPTELGLEQRPEVVVVGIDFGFSHRRLSAAAEAVRSGARFVATNRDPVYPAPSGKLLAGAGAMVAAVEAAAGRAPDLVVGKPEPTLFQTAAKTAGVDAAEAIVIGDSLVSDIPAAHRVGARSILMLTGVTTEEELDRVPRNARPTAVARDADELGAILDEMQPRKNRR